MAEPDDTSAAAPEPAQPDRPAAPAAKKAPVRKAVARKAVARKTVVKQTAAKQTTAKKTAAKKTAAKKATAKKTAAKKTAAKKTAATRSPARTSPGDATPAGFDAAAHSGAFQTGPEQELAGHEAGPAYPQAEDPWEPDVAEEHTDAGSGVAAFARGVRTRGPASEGDVRAAWKDNRLAQVLYHDWEAGSYDDKWSISFDERCISYARDRFTTLVGEAVLAAEPWPYPTALEIGAGTGFFSLNLRQAGVLGEVHVSDVSAGMVAAAQRNARALGFEVTGTVSGAESLPYPDDTFDVVVGHAVIHHIPQVEAALREVLRVLKPGGRFVIAGEPTRVGDWYARRLGRLTWKLTTRVTRLPPLRERWAKPQEELDASSRAAALEAVVDLHTFVPRELAATAARAGARDVHVQTEELLAALLGWPVRTFEAAVNRDRLGWGWARFAYTSWRRLSAVDRVLSRVLPRGAFYNVGVTGTKPRR